MLINKTNYEEFFLLYVDGELSAADKIAVEKFISANPDLREELNVLKETVLVADNEITFGNKDGLYKKQEKTIGFFWWRIAAAVLLLSGTGIWGWIFLYKKEIVVKEIARIDSPEAEGTRVTEPEEYEIIIPEKTQIISVEDKISIQETINVAKTIKIELPTEMPTTSIEPSKEDVSISIVPQQITAVLIQAEKKFDNKTIVYEQVDPTEDDIIYVANTSVPKRNRFRGVIRKAKRILDRVTSIN